MADEEHVATRRLFFAVPLSVESRDAVIATADRVRSAAGPAPARGPGVRWVRMEGLHITVRFLGITPETRLDAARAALRAAAGPSRSFTIRIAGGGAFPSMTRPRVLWLGLTEGVAELAALAGALDRALSADGWPPEERAFRAHLTLARCDGARSGPATAAMLVAEAAGFTTSWRADRLILFQSHPGRGGSWYEPLDEIPLGGAPGS